MAKSVLANARSFRRGSLTTEDLQAMARLSHPSNDALEMATNMSSYDGDAFLWQGELTVDGDFNTRDVDLAWLVVRGSLVVRGLYQDNCDDGPDLVAITGDLIADDVVTAGHLTVHGDVRVSGTIVGDYNDGSTRITGDLKARLFVPADHAFDVQGCIESDYVVDGAIADVGRHRIRTTKWPEIPLVDIRDANELIQQLRAGVAVLHA